MTPQSATAAVSEPMATEPQPKLHEPAQDEGSSPAPDRIGLRKILVNGTVSLAVLVAGGGLGLLYDNIRDKIDRLEDRMDERFAEQDDKIEDLDDKIEDLDAKVDEVVVLLASLIARLEESGTIRGSDAAPRLSQTPDL